MPRLVLFLVAAGALAASSRPLALHPRNPHYFEFRGKPAVLVTSGEHYGAVVNLDFNYRKYLRTLAADGLNHTRTFVGPYREGPGNFNIAGNTLAPAPGRFIAPWPETDGKFDLSRWNEAFFARLRDFLAEASRRGVVVELNLFCPLYEDSMWALSPLNAKNNVSGVGNVARTDVFASKNDALSAVQDAFVRRIVAEAHGFDNVYFEICNEPYFGGVTLEWQRHIAEVIADAEAAYPERHLISQNIANGSRKITDPNPRVSIFNFHYARPPVAVEQNYGLGKPIGCNETGFDGGADATYRIQGWDFLMAGGALYNNLDYSFTAGHEDGTFPVPATNPGGGSPAFRRQLGILKAFFDRVAFVSMAPIGDGALVEGGDASLRVLANQGKVYAGYLHRGKVVKGGKPQYQVDPSARLSRVVLDAPAGRWALSWIDTRTGRTIRTGRLRHAGGKLNVESPAYAEDIAFKIERR